MKIKNFEEIVAWKKAGELSFGVYRQMIKCRDFSFRD